jgi:predicted flavoprotein YhiN
MRINLRFDKYQAVVDKVIFAVGGKSNPNLGSDGSLFDVFANHGYLIIKPEPGLCPIRVQEDVKSLFGQRLHTIASLFINGELLFEEYGEVMFKKDGLSGIVIMNLSSLIGRLKAPNAKIYLAILNQNNEVITVKTFEL